jgi:hypothetical protein
VAQAGPSPPEAPPPPRLKRHLRSTVVGGRNTSGNYLPSVVAGGPSEARGVRLLLRLVSGPHSPTQVDQRQAQPGCPPNLASSGILPQIGRPASTA